MLHFLSITHIKLTAFYGTHYIVNLQYWHQITKNMKTNFTDHIIEKKTKILFIELIDVLISTHPCNSFRTQFIWCQFNLFCISPLFSIMSSEFSIQFTGESSIKSRSIHNYIPSNKLILNLGVLGTFA